MRSSSWKAEGVASVCDVSPATPHADDDLSTDAFLPGLHADAAPRAASPRRCLTLALALALALALTLTPALTLALTPTPTLALALALTLTLTLT